MTEKKIRYSRQREDIYNYMLSSKEHPSAEMVYEALKAEHPNLSLGTVYRNLQQMAQDGRLLEIDGPTARFDGNIEPHTHLRCQKCGCVADVELPYDSALDQAFRMEGWNITGHSLMFTGICPACTGE